MPVTQLRAIQGGRSDQPLAKLEAEAIMRAVGSIRRAFNALPEESEARRRWLASADAAELGARFRWPSVTEPGPLDGGER